MRKNNKDTEGRSWNTFFIYAILVIFVILISLTVKGFFILQKSRFDGKHHFVLAIAKEGKVNEVIVFNPPSHSLVLLKLEASKLPLSSIGRILGIAPDGSIESAKDFLAGEDIEGALMASLLHFASIKTNLTALDMGQLFLFSKNISSDDKVVKELRSLQEESDTDEIIASFFGDSTVVSEGVNIQIVNASDMLGMGKRFERVVSNLGGNVVSVSTAHRKEQLSKINYSGTDTYTLKKMIRLFNFPVSRRDEKGAPNMTIIIGEDSKNAKNF